MKLVATLAVLLAATTLCGQEEPIKLSDGYYSLSQFPSEIKSYLSISGDSAVLNWVDSGKIFEFLFENLQDITVNEDGYTKYQYKEPDGYNLYPYFLIKPSEDMDGTFDMEFIVFEKSFNKRIEGTNYYHYGKGKVVGTCCAPFKRFDTEEQLINRQQ